MDEVKLYQAFYWACLSCGKRQFCKARFVELSEEEREFLQEDYGFTPQDIAGQDFVTVPPRVRCRGCKAVYKTSS